MGKKLCKEKKTKDVSERNCSSERAHFKKCVVPVAIQYTVFGLGNNGKAGVLWYLTVLRPFLNFFHSGVVGATCHVVLGCQPFRFISKSHSHDGFHILYIFGGFSVPLRNITVSN